MTTNTNDSGGASPAHAQGSPGTEKRPLDAIALDLVLLVFVGSLVGTALLNLGAGARLMPLLIGFPTLMGIVGLLLRDLLRNGRARVQESQSQIGTRGWRGKEVQQRRDESSPHPAQGVGRFARGAGKSASGIVGRVVTPGAEGRGARARRALFALWAVGLFTMAVFFGLLVSIPLALFFFFKILNREGWVLSTALTISTWLLIYALFDLLLGVQF